MKKKTLFQLIESTIRKRYPDAIPDEASKRSSITIYYHGLNQDLWESLPGDASESGTFKWKSYHPDSQIKIVYFL